MIIDYPSWICNSCGKKYGSNTSGSVFSTWHIGECGWCKQKTSVTEPRDFGYPKYNKDMGATNLGEEK